MHVAINAHLLAHTRNFRRAGVSNYTEQLIQHLAQIDRDNRYTIFTTRGLGNRQLALPPNFTVRSNLLPTINPRIRIPWEQFVAPVLLRMLGADVYHGVLNVMPLASPVPSVVTIHDLSPFLFPQTFRRVNRTYTRWAIKVAARNAAQLLAVSEFTRREMVRWLEVPPERVTVTYNGVGNRFRPQTPEAIAALKQRHQLPDRFVLFVGTLEPRKNLPTLLEAYARIVRDTDATLVIGGGKGWLYDEIFARAEQLNLGKRLHFAGFIDDDELPLWYAAASVFVLPSLYEGFGIPVLEAMACGTPVVTTTSSSLPEVAGNAALIVPPTDSEAMAGALLQLLTDAGLRDELRERGFIQARRFSWRSTAQQTIQVYQAAATQATLAAL
ncbi:MAG TPA: glycosyltransferase family 1 protein [Roseiflexaceae bacterium]|nr:glycosyltransferase family 1 protein [Roseiflexaceae bacterium]